MRATTSIALSLLAACSAARTSTLPKVEGVPTRPAAATSSAQSSAPPRSTAELQRAWLDATLAAIDAHDAKTLAAMYAEDATVVSPGVGGMEVTTSRAAIEADHRALFERFPDLAIAPTLVLQRDDALVMEWTATGTNTGDVDGKKASGRGIGFHAVSIFAIDAGGLARSEHVYVDQLTIAVQLGKETSTARAKVALPTAAPRWISASTLDDGALVAVLHAQQAAIEGHDLEAFAATLTERVRIADYTAEEDTLKRESATESLEALVRAIPDLRVTESAHWTFGDFAVVEESIAGTQLGKLGGYRASNKAIELHRCEVLHFDSARKIDGIARFGNTVELIAQIATPKEKKKKTTP